MKHDGKKSYADSMVPSNPGKAERTGRRAIKPPALETAPSRRSPPLSGHIGKIVADRKPSVITLQSRRTRMRKDSVHPPRRISYLIAMLSDVLARLTAQFVICIRSRFVCALFGNEIHSYTERGEITGLLFQISPAGSDAGTCRGCPRKFVTSARVQNCCAA
ncbi:hypothetical protein EVAR_47101_1 [Eumeta japonica]|uniref:Uncharacterized protein n=1 Tax=Eumeta variegata TaxID=151549 RepID=A0A4C1YAZ2_EUMVA|nr:hypothetical protein EVAR_47101_1 [Eumeta japonica]